MADHLRSRGIATGLHYPVPLHLQSCYREWGYRAGSLPVTERAAREILSLPMFPGLEQPAQERVAVAIAEHLASRRSAAPHACPRRVDDRQREHSMKINITVSDTSVGVGRLSRRPWPRGPRHRCRSAQSRQHQCRTSAVVEPGLAELIACGVSSGRLQARRGAAVTPTSP